MYTNRNRRMVNIEANSVPQETFTWGLAQKQSTVLSRFKYKKGQETHTKCGVVFAYFIFYFIQTIICMECLKFLHTK